MSAFRPAALEDQLTVQLRAPRATSSGDDAQARAYLELLASSGLESAAPHPARPVPSGPPPPSSADPTGAAAAYAKLASGRPPVGPPSTACLALVASSEPLPHSTPVNRSPATPIASVLLGKHGRRAMMVALIAGISVAGVSAAAVNANQVQAAAPHSQTLPIPTASATGPTIASGRAGVASVASIEPAPEAEPKLSFTLVRRKTKPAPVPVPVPTVKWVNPLPEAVVTSCFGERWGRLHAGVDLAAPNGTPIRAAGAGVVVSAGAAEGYGNAVLIDHGNGYLTHYGHMSAIVVPVGQQVAAGQEIGLEGSTGHSTGPHLHFEVHQGGYRNPIEPTGWLREHGVEIPGCAPRTVPVEPRA